jgi:hypothetical protein
MMFVPFASVVKFEDQYWFNPDYLVHKLGHRCSNDWEIIKDSEPFELKYVLSKAETARFDKFFFWTKFLKDPRENLDINDFFWGRIHTEEKGWIHRYKPAKIELEIKEDFSYENLAHKFFVVGETLQKKFSFSDENGENEYSLSLEEFDQLMRNEKAWNKLKDVQKVAIEHMDFLKTLPHWEKLKGWRG